MDRSGYVRPSSEEPCAHSLNSDLYAAFFSTAMPVVLAGQVRQSKRRRRAGRGRFRLRHSEGSLDATVAAHMVQINASVRLPPNVAHVILLSRKSVFHHRTSL